MRIVVVNFNGGPLTVDCLRSLLETEWPRERLEIVLVDNASDDGIADRVEQEFPGVRVVRSPKNLGFAGGCNLGMTDLGSADYVGLMNNDATVEPGWLTPLVEALEQDKRLGAACPKILFAGKFRDLTIHSSATPSGRGDQRAIGVRVSGAQIDDDDVWPRAQLVQGFWGVEPPLRRGEPSGQWTAAEASLRLPVAPTRPGHTRLRLSAAHDTTVTIETAAGHREATAGPVATWMDVPFGDGASVSVINNVGTMLTPDLYGADRGYLEVDDGQFDHAEDVFAWCGGAALLRRKYLDDVGPFDERLFLYYEDLELSWRGAKRGWTYRYVPSSRVHHVHAATSVEGSPLKSYFDERNRLLVLTRHARAAELRRATLRYLLVTGSYARRDLLARVLRGRAPSGAVVARRLHAFGGYLWRAPGMLRSRRRDRRRTPRVEAQVG